MDSFLLILIFFLLFPCIQDIPMVNFNICFSITPVLIRFLTTSEYILFCPLNNRSFLLLITTQSNNSSIGLCGGPSLKELILSSAIGFGFGGGIHLDTEFFLLGSSVSSFFVVGSLRGFLLFLLSCTLSLQTVIIIIIVISGRFLLFT